MGMEDSKPEEKTDDGSTRFNKSLKELKDLCSQIHYAADYCEKSYRNAQNGEKKGVMENTKEYICRAVVTVVDHLGSVSAQLDGCVSSNKVVSEADFQITGLNQRLVALQKYSQKLSLTRLCWNMNFPRYHTRYIFPPMPGKGKPNEAARERDIRVGAKNSDKREFETEDPSNHKPGKCSIRAITHPTSALVLPVRGALSALPKARNPSFDFEATRKIKRNMPTRRLVQSSIIRKSKVAA